MILFGWGHTTRKNFGPTFEQECSNCHNTKYWILTRIRVWFTLFFIPVFPYENKHFLSCPICQHGLTLNSQQLQEVKPLAEMNQLLVDGQITKEEYQRRILTLNGDSPIQGEPRVHDVEPESVVDINKNDLRFCSQCGSTVAAEAKFCGGCGTNTNK
jgi:hypothetical protein